uniref:Uncharacterized protein n=1 Tax=Glossina austeni TaxID=7395 RepID=A0A1A9VFK7_GLOAU
MYQKIEGEINALVLSVGSKAAVQHTRHVKGDKSRKLPDDCGRQKHVEKTVITPECRKHHEGRMPEEKNETNVKSAKQGVLKAQLGNGDLKIITAAKKDERVSSEQIDKESSTANAY